MFPIFEILERRRMIALGVIVLALPMTPMLRSAIAPEYVGAAQLLLVRSAPTSGVLASNQAVAKLVTDRAVLGRVSAGFHGRPSVAELQTGLSVAAPEHANLISIAYASRDRLAARDVPNAAADETVRYGAHLATAAIDASAAALHTELVRRGEEVAVLDTLTERLARSRAVVEPPASADRSVSRLAELADRRARILATYLADREGVSAASDSSANGASDSANASAATGTAGNGGASAAAANTATGTANASAASGAANASAASGAANASAASDSAGANTASGAAGAGGASGGAQALRAGTEVQALASGASATRSAEPAMSDGFPGLANAARAVPDRTAAPEAAGGRAAPEAAGGRAAPEAAGGRAAPEAAGGRAAPGTAGDRAARLALDVSRLASADAAFGAERRRLASVATDGGTVEALRARRDLAHASFATLATRYAAAEAERVETGSRAALIVLVRSADAPERYPRALLAFAIGVALLALAVVCACLVDACDPRGRKRDLRPRKRAYGTIS